MISDLSTTVSDQLRNDTVHRTHLKINVQVSDYFGKIMFEKKSC